MNMKICRYLLVMTLSLVLSWSASATAAEDIMFLTKSTVSVDDEGKEILSIHYTRAEGLNPGSFQVSIEDHTFVKENKGKCFIPVEQMIDELLKALHAGREIHVRDRGFEHRGRLEMWVMKDPTTADTIYGVRQPWDTKGVE